MDYFKNLELSDFGLGFVIGVAAMTALSGFIILMMAFACN